MWVSGEIAFQAAGAASTKVQRWECVWLHFGKQTVHGRHSRRASVMWDHMQVDLEDNVSLSLIEHEMGAFAPFNLCSPLSSPLEKGPS